MLKNYNPDLEKYLQTLQSDINQMQQLQKNLFTWDLAYENSQNITFIIWPRKMNFISQAKDEAKAIRDVVKDKFNKKINKLLVVNSKQACQDIYDMYKILKKLENLILEFDEKFSKAKREQNIVDFSDIEHFALQIFQNKEICKIYAEKFEEIAIDEYQDSNKVQECILTAISRENNMFMVGDIKQSIYKFRQAMPELFLEKYKKYEKVGKKDSIGTKIQLFKNFRSRSNVLDFTNIIFENIMSETLGDVEYTEEEYLNLGATDYEENSQNLKTEIDKLQDKDYVARYARENYLYTKDGEYVIKALDDEEKKTTDKFEITEEQIIFLVMVIGSLVLFYIVFKGIKKKKKKGGKK